MPKLKSPSRTIVKSIPKGSNGRAPSKAAIKTPSKAAAKTKMVYYFGGGKADGDGSMKPLLGGKGANLAEIAHRPAGAAGILRSPPKSARAFIKPAKSSRRA